MTDNHKPAYECRCGLVRATVWRRRSKRGDFYEVTFSRSYRAGNGWRETDGFSFRQMRALSDVLKNARAWMRANGETE